MSAPALRPRALLRTLGPATVCAAAAIGVVAAAGDGGGSATPLAIAGLLMLSGLAASALHRSGEPLPVPLRRGAPTLPLRKLEAVDGRPEAL